MNVLEPGSKAPSFNAVTADGVSVSLLSQLAKGPLVVAFGMPSVFASRLVVGYLRRLKSQVPDSAVWIVLQGRAEEVEAYCRGYLDGPLVIHDGDLYLSHIYQVTHVPTIYLIAADGSVVKAFTGFLREGMNALATSVAESYGAKPKQLITPLDNKGEYELAEKALSG